jgi:hypothetical protein
MSTTARVRCQRGCVRLPLSIRRRRERQRFGSEGSVPGSGYARAESDGLSLVIPVIAVLPVLFISANIDSDGKPKPLALKDAGIKDAGIEDQTPSLAGRRRMLIQNSIVSGQLAFPILECFHIGGFAFSIGMTALVDFRLLGLGLLDETPAEIASSGLWWSLGGLLVAVFSGFLIFSTDPDMYYLNWIFDAKMAVLVLAIVFNYTIHRKAVAPDASPAAGRRAAVVSLALWLAVIFGGIFIAALQ